MRSILGIISIFLLLTPQCFAANCRTCRGNDCQNENIEFRKCTKLSWMLPSRTYLVLPKNKENLQYGCLKLEYLHGKSTEVVQKCIITEDISTVCQNIAKSIPYTSCHVELPTDLEVQRETDIASVSESSKQTEYDLADTTDTFVTEGSKTSEGESVTGLTDLFSDARPLQSSKSWLMTSSDSRMEILSDLFTSSVPLSKDSSSDDTVPDVTTTHYFETSSAGKIPISLYEESETEITHSSSSENDAAENIAETFDETTTTNYSDQELKTNSTTPASFSTNETTVHSSLENEPSMEDTLPQTTTVNYLEDISEANSFSRLPSSLLDSSGAGNDYDMTTASITETIIADWTHVTASLTDSSVDTKLTTKNYFKHELEIETDSTETAPPNILYSSKETDDTGFMPDEPIDPAAEDLTLPAVTDDFIGQATIADTLSQTTSNYHLETDSYSRLPGFLLDSTDANHVYEISTESLPASETIIAESIHVTVSLPDILIDTIVNEASTKNYSTDEPETDSAETTHKIYPESATISHSGELAGFAPHKPVDATVEDMNPTASTTYSSLRNESMDEGTPLQTTSNSYLETDSYSRLPGFLHDSTGANHVHEITTASFPGIETIIVNSTPVTVTLPDGLVDTDVNEATNENYLNDGPETDSTEIMTENYHESATINHSGELTGFVPDKPNIANNVHEITTASFLGTKIIIVNSTPVTVTLPDGLVDTVVNEATNENYFSDEPDTDSTEIMTESYHESATINHSGELTGFVPDKPNNANNVHEITTASFLGSETIIVNSPHVTVTLPDVVIDPVVNEATSENYFSDDPEMNSTEITTEIYHESVTINHSGELASFVPGKPNHVTAENVNSTALPAGSFLTEESISEATIKGTLLHTTSSSYLEIDSSSRLPGSLLVSTSADSEYAITTASFPETTTVNLTALPTGSSLTEELNSEATIKDTMLHTTSSSYLETDSSSRLPGSLLVSTSADGDYEITNASFPETTTVIADSSDSIHVTVYLPDASVDTIVTEATTKNYFKDEQGTTPETLCDSFNEIADIKSTTKSYPESVTINQSDEIIDVTVEDSNPTSENIDEALDLTDEPSTKSSQIDKDESSTVEPNDIISSNNTELPVDNQDLITPTTEFFPHSTPDEDEAFSSPTTISNLDDVIIPATSSSTPNAAGAENSTTILSTTIPSNAMDIEKTTPKEAESLDHTDNPSNLDEANGYNSASTIDFPYLTCTVLFLIYAIVS